MTTKPKHLTLRTNEVARFLRPSGLVVLPVKRKSDFRHAHPFTRDDGVGVVFTRHHNWTGVTNSETVYCPLGGPGTEWVGREAWFPCSTFDPSEETGAIYRADAWRNGNEPSVKWKPARTMPEWASRIRKTTTRVELRRVNTITNDECELLPIEPDRATDHPRGVWYTAFMAEFNARYPGSWDRDDYAWFVFYTDTL